MKIQHSLATIFLAFICFSNCNNGPETTPDPLESLNEMRKEATKAAREASKDLGRAVEGEVEKQKREWANDSLWRDSIMAELDSMHLDSLGLIEMIDSIYSLKKNERNN